MLNFFSTAEQRVAAKNAKNAKADEAAMLYLAKELSKKTHEEEEKKRVPDPNPKKTTTRQNKPPMKERSFRGKPMLDEYGIPLVPDEKSTKSISYSYDEYGIPLVDDSKSSKPVKAQAQAQAFPPTANAYYQQYPQGYYPPNYPQQGYYPQNYYNYPGYPYPYPQVSPPPPSAEGEYKPETKHHDKRANEQKQDAGLEDPEVKAFMEKRKQKQQQLKEQQLQQELLREAQRLNIAAESVDPNDHRRSPVPNATQKIIQTADPNISKRMAVTKSPAPEQVAAANIPRPPLINTSTDAPPKPAPVQTTAAGQQTTEGIVDQSHILHPSNSIAFKAASALYQLARKHPTITSLPSETAMIASTQLAGMWINQTAFYLTKMEKNPPAAAAQSPSVGMPPKPVISTPTKKLNSKQSFRKEVIDSMSARLEERILRTSSQDKSSPSMRQSRSSSMRNLNELLQPKKTRSSESQQQDQFPVRVGSSGGNSKNSWNCSVCTLRNKGNYLSCEACGTPKDQ